MQVRKPDLKSPQKQPKLEGLLSSATAAAALRKLTGKKRPAEDDLDGASHYWPSQWLEAKEEQQARRHASSCLNVMQGVIHMTGYQKAGHLHSHLVQRPAAIMLTSPHHSICSSAQCIHVCG